MENSGISTIERILPLMESDSVTQVTWVLTTSGRTMYVFSAKLADGTTGEFNSTLETPRLKVGDEVEYVALEARGRTRLKIIKTKENAIT